MKFHTDNDKYKIIIEKANISLEWLIDNGFILNDVYTKYSKLAGESINMDYHNELTGIKFFLSFRGSFGEYYDMFSVIIQNKEGHYFLLSDYLTKHKLESEKCSFVLRDEETKFEVFVDNFLELLNKLLKSELNQIITGKVWEEVPFDWRGLK